MTLAINSLHALAFGLHSQIKHTQNDAERKREKEWGRERGEWAAQSRITVEIKMYKKGHLNWTYGTTTSASIAAHTRTHTPTHTATFYSYYYKLGGREGQGSLQIQQLPAAAAAATITICPFVVDNQWAVALAEQEDEREGVCACGLSVPHLVSPQWSKRNAKNSQ